MREKNQILLKNISEDYLKSHSRELMKSILDHDGHGDFDFVNSFMQNKCRIIKHANTVPVVWARSTQ